jgi:hypothetical protein
LVTSGGDVSHRRDSSHLFDVLPVTLFNDLGFRWDRAAILQGLPTRSTKRVCFYFHRMLPEYIWHASVLEGSPFTFPEAKTLMDGVTVGGRRIADQARS